jgi:hypothetical protein
MSVLTASRAGADCGCSTLEAQVHDPPAPPSPETITVYETCRSVLELGDTSPSIYAHESFQPTYTR